jgi:hypothetical protein
MLDETSLLDQKLNLDIEWIQPPFGEAAMASHGTLFLAHAPTLLT